MGRLMVRRLCALAALATVLVLPPQVLVATCNVPQPVAAVLAGVAGSTSGGSCVPSSALGSLVGFMALCVWVYLVLVAILRAAAVLGARARIAGASWLLTLTNRLAGGGWVRRLVDVALGLAMVTASGAGQLATPDQPDAPDATPGAFAAAAAPTHGSPRAAGGVDQPASIARDEPMVRYDEDRRWHVVRPGETLAMIAEQELGDPRLDELLFEQNQGRPMPDGGRLENPNLLRPGWIIELPSPRFIPPPATAPPELAPPATTASPSVPPPMTAPQQRRPHVVIELPSGSVIAFSLWVAMASALLLALLRNRRARLPEPPEPGICRYHPETATVTQQVIDRGQALATDEPWDVPASGQAEDAATPPLPTLALDDLACTDPGRVLAAERDDRPIDLDLTGLGALVLRGPDATRAARAAVVTMLTQHGPASAEVLAVGDVLEHVPDFPGLRRAGDLAGALSVLEAEAIHRTRRLDAEDIDDFTGYRRQRPDDPLPALVLLADHVPTTQTGRLEALAAQASRLGMSILLVDAQVEGAACIELDDTGTVAHATPTALADQLLGARMFSLSAAEAADLLATLARARSDQPASPLAPQPAEPFTPPDPAPSPPLRVRLLGSYRVETATAKRLGRGVRRKALELLAFYLLNPDGATQEQAVEALWPNAPLGREAQWFWNALGSLRRAIRDLCGDRDLQVIARDGDRYRIDPALFDVDLWRFESSLDQAKQAASAGDERAEAPALATAAQNYSGQLLDGHAGSWVTTPREDLRRRAVNALARLAELRERAGDQTGALAALHQAITIDTVAEELYRRTMRLQARVGLVDEARHTYHTLEHHLTELDLDPEPATETLAAKLLVPRRPPPRSRP